MQLVNLSPFASEHLVLMDANAEERLIVVVKATYSLTQGVVRLHEKQESVRLADEYHGEPGKSSIKHAGEAVPFKPATDVILVGSARPFDKDRGKVDVVLRLGELRKTVRVFGDRVWKRTLGFLTISKPEPFEKVPLIYERAFGGVDGSLPERVEADSRNFVGVGFRGKKSKFPLFGMRLPNLEHPGDRITGINKRPAPACFSFISPHWQPRASYAGTYDDAWQKKRSPLLPDDFNTSFYQTAPADQVYNGYVSGGEPVEVLNASPSGRLAFTIPKVNPRVAVKIATEFRELEMRLDTVVIDSDRECLLLTWRGSTAVHARIYDVQWIRVTAEGISR